jgi:hypothetical protein
MLRLGSPPVTGIMVGSLDIHPVNGASACHAVIAFASPSDYYGWHRCGSCVPLRVPDSFADGSCLLHPRRPVQQRGARRSRRKTWLSKHVPFAPWRVRRET